MKTNPDISKVFSTGGTKAKAAATKAKASNGSSTAPIPMADNGSVSVRKIENGFIVSQSGYIGNGKNQKYFSKEFFSPTNPVEIAKTPVSFSKK